jgi:hypothetical protein
MWFSLKENHMQSTEAVTLDRKSGGEPRDLRFRGPILEMFFLGALQTPQSEVDPDPDYVSPPLQIPNPGTAYRFGTHCVLRHHPSTNPIVPDKSHAE